MGKDFKTIALVAVGVFVAGLVMNQLKDVTLVKQARQGFDA